MSNKIALTPGMRITCQKNNHFICEVIDTIRQHDMNWSRKLGNWQMPEPERGSYPVCHECGSWFWTTKCFGGILHIEGHGWISNDGNRDYIEEKPIALAAPEPKSSCLIDRLLNYIGI